MTQFIQLHLLTFYPPGNPNRDDLGRPKTATLGGTQRLRISSQSLKRAWRESPVFEETLGEHIGQRTREMAVEIYEKLKKGNIEDKKAFEWAQQIKNSFFEDSTKESSKKKSSKTKKGDDEEALSDSSKNKKDSKKQLQFDRLVHFSPDEIKAIDNLVDKLINEKRGPKNEELGILRKNISAADIALFGRMLTSKSNSMKIRDDAAVQVGHSISIHSIALEDDFFTAVDDINKDEDVVAAGHAGEFEFASALMYLYVCINRDLLQSNLNNDADLTRKTLRALTECATTVAPSGKQNSFATRTRASFVLAEKGSQQPRTLSVAWLNAFEGNGDFGGSAVQTLMDTREKLDKAYGPCADASKTMNAFTGEGSLKEILDFIAE